MITWIVFSASAASSWIVNGVRGNKTDTEAEEAASARELLALFWDLSAPHGKLGYFDFHVGLVRHLLYGLAEKNIAFSPFIFHLLDKRERRQIVTGQLMSRSSNS
jgi:hypothetical protein